MGEDLVAGIPRLTLSDYFSRAGTTHRARETDTPSEGSGFAGGRPGEGQPQADQQVASRSDTAGGQPV